MGIIVDLTNQKFGLLKVLQRTRKKNGKLVWKCVCVCSQHTFVETAKLRSGHTKSCGCLKKQKHLFKNKVGRPYKYDINNYLGKNFGDWTIEGFSHFSQTKNQYWLAKCKCGIKKSVSLTNLISGESTRCSQCHLSSQKGNQHPQWQGTTNIPKTFLNRIKIGARERNIKFNIVIDDLEILYLKQNQRCAYTNIKLTFASDSSQTASLDRIDSSKGYEITNIQFLHKDINLMKLNLDEDAFLNFVEHIFLGRCNASQK
tara:strand:+ start:44 stop:817 length:774 start_codon:yes stop_codon:yes gene_type:complete